MFKGVYTALVTPFRNGKLDEEAYIALVNRQVDQGVDGVVPVGSTGESSTLSPEEHLHVIELAVKTVAGRIKVIAGTGANSTVEAVHLTQSAEKLGADASLLVAPYYNKPSQDGLFEHFSQIARSVKIPLILYSIPGRCGIEIGVETVRRLAEANPNIVSIKEAGGNSDRVSQLMNAVKVPGFTILSGDDPLTLSFMAVGAQGVISVASNVIPAEVSAMVRAFAAGNTAEALRIHQKYYSLFKALFVETNPVPVKTALSMMGKCTEEVRMPLYHLSDKSCAVVKQTLEALNLITKAKQ
ncbi:MAG: 4-hydroxy-tetrahydrodipicolinate synthase [Verrucomicrobia bacterium]|jgi:4-hydroxy-tetrahydrodipicolinate synthase|nr:4-hydroxy-tetrahydrodipicolinate synthase [Verrucomicrobiota bacterium]